MKQKSQVPQVQRAAPPVYPQNQRQQTNQNQKPNQIDELTIRIINHWSETANRYFAVQYQHPKLWQKNNSLNAPEIKGAIFLSHTTITAIFDNS